MHNVEFLSPRRRRQWFSAQVSAITPPPTSFKEEPTLKERLEALLNFIPRFLDRATNQTPILQESVSSSSKQSSKSIQKRNPFRFLQFWKNNRENIDRTKNNLLNTAESALRQDGEGFRRNANLLDFRWLTGSAGDPDFGVLAKEFGLFALDSLSPWDFDRHDFGVTFVTTWEDLEAGDIATGIKVTSTIKPLESEWKVSARTKLIELGENALVFGKAGLYLAGEQSPFIGVEADRMWNLPQLSNTKLFCNANYRSSRKADLPFRMSVGLQHNFELTKGVVLTLRFGAYPFEKPVFFATPVPNGNYF